MKSIKFSNKQAAHARKVILDLMRKRRFFLATDEKDRYYINQKTFGEAIGLNQKIKNYYSSTRDDAENSIKEFEYEMNLVGPVLKQNQRVVQCNCFNGGLSILNIYPLNFFLERLPNSFDDLVEENFERAKWRSDENDYSVNELNNLRKEAEGYAKSIWDENSKLQILDVSLLSVVLMKTRFHPSWRDENADFMEGKVWNIQKYPHLLGYLFWKCSQDELLVPDSHHSHIVFSTSRKRHVRIEHRRDSKSTLTFTAEAGYDCIVCFSTIL